MKSRRSTPASKTPRKSKALTFPSLVKNISVNDDNWRCSVSMLVETEENQLAYTAALSRAEATRKAVHIISKSGMPANIRRLTATDFSSTVSAKPSPSLEKIRECARAALLREEGEGDSDGFFEAELIKWMIYEARLESLARRELELELLAEQERELEAMRRPPAKSERANSARRANSSLRRRGEEWKDRIFIDDAPVDGPDLYVLLTGFREPGLPSDLIKLGVPLHCVLKLESRKSSDSCCGDFVCGLCSSDGYDSSGLFSSVKSSSKSLSSFWESLSSKECDDLAVRRFCPRWSPDGSGEARELYDAVSYMLYDVHDTLEAHADYLRSMRLVSLDAHEAYARPDRLGSIPEECASVPVVLDALLRRIDEPPDREQTHRGRAEKEEGEEAAGATSLSKVSSAAFARLTKKLCLLNLKYELISPASESAAPRRPEPELILHGDALRLNACRANDARDAEAAGPEGDGAPRWNLEKLASAAEGVLREPRIAEASRRTPTRMPDQEKIMKAHLAGIYKCCEKQGIDWPRARHLLNLLAFRRLAESYYASAETSRTCCKCCECSSERVVRRGSSGAEESLSGRSDANSSVNHRTSGVWGASARSNRAGEKVRRNSETVERQQSFVNYDELREINSADVLASSGSTNENAYSSRGMKQPFERSKLYDTSLPDSRTASTSRSTASQRPSRRVPSLNGCEPDVDGPADSGDGSYATLRSFEDCPELFGLIDPRESLGLGGSGTGCPLELGLFEDVELLAPRAFLQIVRDCFLEYGGYVMKRFAPTDSILLLFADEVKEASGRHGTFALRTPVCLRDFCDYVEEEERDWLERRRPSHGGLRRRSLLSALGAVEEEPMFRDEDFILPGSLKEQDLRLANGNEESVYAGEESIMKSFSSVKARKTRRKTTSSSIASRRVSNGGRPELRSLGSGRPSANSFDFVGYEVGDRRRVQVTHSRHSFEASDGTRLRLTREIWLLGAAGEQRSTSLAVFSPGDNGCCLTCHRNQSTAVFQLNVPGGITAAFEKIKDFDDTRPDDLLYEIQISCPSGLVIKPEAYPDADHPFYICQHYTTRPLSDVACVKNETRRKYLHNGDVVKFLNDGTIIVLRANATIITVLNFRGGDGNSLLTSESNERFKGSGLEQEASRSLELPPSYLDELRYTVLEPDGRYYEVREGRIVNEFDRLRASLMEDYDSEEKFLRREDGTDALYTSDGRLVVCFPDGTRTLTDAEIEDAPASCDWSAEELELHFGAGEPEGFVSVLLYSRVEHPSYATVLREPASGVCGLSLAERPRIQLEGRGRARILVDDRTMLELSDTDVTMSRRSCRTCREATSKATFHLAEDDARLMSFQDGDRSLEVALRGGGFACAAGEEPPSLSAGCRCLFRGSSPVPPRRAARIFAVGGDGSIHEYHHRRERQQLERLATAESDHGAGLLARPIERRPGTERSLYLLPPPRVLGDSRRWLFEHRIPRTRPSPRHRFGSAEEGEEERPLVDRRAAGGSFLIARLLEGIAAATPDENSLISMQRALVRYWRELATGAQWLGGGDQPGMMCRCLGDVEAWMTDVALGKVRTIDWESYERGRKYLKELKVKRDEERTRQIIEHSYRPYARRAEFPWLHD